MRHIGYLITLIVTSLYFFPFEFSFLPGVNTKMAMAVLGLILAVYSCAKNRSIGLPKEYIWVFLLALLTSFWGIASTTYNSTNDYTYASYFVSMAVWLGGAYFVVQTISFIHGQANTELVCNYLIAVCVAQCGLALVIDQVPAVKAFVDSFLGGSGFMGKSESRLYGIGCSLDVAGTRFCAVLIMTAEMISRSKGRKLVLYVFSFYFLTVVGNMIARTTTVGVVLAICYLLLRTFFISPNLGSGRKSWIIIGVCFVLTSVLIFILYDFSPVFKAYFRFAFEGFFSLAETGLWEVSSNDILKSMVVFPDNARTWLIGDGYFENPWGVDLNYIGPEYYGFYMQTDIGYLRFLFYFGICGLLTFIAYFIFVSRLCVKRLSDYKLLFVFIVVLNFILWFKVSTDIFLVFALFMCLPIESEQFS